MIDLHFSCEMGFPIERMNPFGSSLIYRHPRAPTGLRAITELLGALVEGGPPTMFGWESSATIMYMSQRVGVAELRQNLSRFLERVARGERLIVTDHNRPVAELGPPPITGAALDRLIAEGRVGRPVRRRLPEPLELDGDPYALSRALDEIRGEG